jgi:hypothetical protein
MITTIANGGRSGKRYGGLHKPEPFTSMEKKKMLWTILVLLLVLWLIGVIGGIAGGLIHLLLVVALVIFVINLLTGRSTV